MGTIGFQLKNVVFSKTGQSVNNLIFSDKKLDVFSKSWIFQKNNCPNKNWNCLPTIGFVCQKIGSFNQQLDLSTKNYNFLPTTGFVIRTLDISDKKWICLSKD